MKVFITGINGFVGTILKARLLEKGIDVYGICIKESSEKIFSCDITDAELTAKVLLQISPDIIIHLAAISRVDFENPGELYSSNVTGTLNLLSAACRLNRKPGFIFVSSSQVYGSVEKIEQPISETCMVNPVNHYGASKAAAENLVMAFRKEYGIPALIARPFNHTGRGQTEHFVIPKIVKAFRERRGEITLGNIDVIRDISDVRDVVNSYALMIENIKDG